MKQNKMKEYEKKNNNNSAPYLLTKKKNFSLKKNKIKFCLQKNK